MLRSIVNFCFSVEERISIDYTPSDKSTKRGRPKCRNAPRRGGEGERERGKGEGTKVRRKLRKGPFTCPFYPHLEGSPRRICATKHVVDFWLIGS